MFNFVSLLALVANSFAGTNPLEETSCSFMINYGNGKVRTVRIPDLSVLDPPANQPRFEVETVDGVVLDGVICKRSRPMIAGADFRVVSTGIPFYVVVGEPEDPNGVIIVLEQTEVGHRVRHIEGRELNEEEESEIVEVIDQLNRKQSGEKVGEA